MLFDARTALINEKVGDAQWQGIQTGKKTITVFIGKGELMSDLIDRQDAIDAVAFGITYTKVFDKETGKVKVKELFAEGNYELKNAIDRIKELPSVDAVEVVRCKDCKFASYEPCKDFVNVYVCNYSYWTRAQGGRYPDWYCARAERRTDAVE